MADTPSAATSAASSGRSTDDIDHSRMSFGDHLEELRSRLIKALLGLVVTTVLSLVFARQVLAVLYQPLLVVLDMHGLPTSLQALGVSDVFTSYLRMALLTGLVVAVPWMLYQVWMFVAAGLYSHERRFVKLFGPVSLLLFGIGVVFTYYIVLPMCLNFFVIFNQGFTVPELNRSGLFRLMFKAEPPPPAPDTSGDLASVPVLAKDPSDPAPGSMWVNQAERRLKVRTADGTLSMPLELRGASSAIRSEFSLQAYVSFVLSLALGFGIAFELPVAVVFLALTRIAPTRVLGRFRKHIIVFIVIAAGVLTPPDVLSQMLMAVPMVALFEGGLLAAKIVERRRPAEESGSFL